MWQRAATTSSLLPWNRNETKGGGPVRISAPSPPGQVHTHTHVHMHDDQARELSRSLHTRALWENSAGRTVSGLQGYPVSRANEPRELPYVLVRRKDRQGLPVVNGRPSFSRPVPIHFRAREKIVRSSSSSASVKFRAFPFNSNFQSSIYIFVS